MWRKNIFLLITLGAGLWYPFAVLGAMSSTNYYIYADSVGVNGGGLSVTGTYSLEDTLGESPVGVATSTSYEARGGYQAMERGELSLAISSASLSLGTLSASAVNTASTTLTVSSDASTGYTLSVGSVSGSLATSFHAVSDSSVTAGSEEYGASGSGGDNQLSGDVAITNGLVVASANTPRVNSATVLTFKAAMSNATVAGPYSETITFTASANF